MPIEFAECGLLNVRSSPKSDLTLNRQVRNAVS